EERKVGIDFESWAFRASTEYEVKAGAVKASKKRSAAKSKKNAVPIIPKVQRTRISYRVLEPFRVAGAWLPRYKGFDVNNIAFILQIGLGEELKADMVPEGSNEDDQDDDGEDEEADTSLADLSEERKAVYLDVYQAMKQAHPTVCQRLKETCMYLKGDWQGTFFSYLVNVIRYGFRSARKADTSKSKGEIRLIVGNPDIEWDDRNVIPYLDGKEKHHRGVGHSSIAPLLCTTAFIDKFKSVDKDVRLA
ncbi:hypothetical protein MPER_11225, partial [Moniliophthora perniciosa FA553]